MPDPTCTDPRHDHGPNGTVPSILCGRPGDRVAPVRLVAVAAPQLHPYDGPEGSLPRRQFCRKGMHSCTPALTLIFGPCSTCGREVRTGVSGPEHVDPATHVNGIHVPTLNHRLHWCAEHAFFAGSYRASAVEIIDHRGDERGFYGSPDRGDDIVLTTAAGTSGLIATDDLRALAGHVDERDGAAAGIREASYLEVDDHDVLTDAQLREWLTARGVTGRDLQLYVGQNRGKTRGQMDAEYDRICGPMA